MVLDTGLTGYTEIQYKGRLLDQNNYINNVQAVLKYNQQ